MDNHQKQCKVCAFGPENLDFTLSHAAISQIVDCAKRSVGRHIAWAEANGFALNRGASLQDTEGAPGWVNTSGTPRRAWQLPDGTWRQSFQHAGTDPLPEVHLDNELIDRLILDWPTALAQTDWYVDDDLAFIADPQLGKANEQGGGTDETIARTLASVEAVAQRWALLKPRNGYVCDLGDLIENLFSTPAQVSTNDRSLPEQVEDAVALYMNVLGRLLPLVGTLHHATVTSNHGEARTGPKVNPYGSENDWGLMIQRTIQGRCEDRGWDVVFHRPEHNEDTTVLTMTDGTEVALNHGHHSGSPQKMKAWVTGQIVGRRPGWNARVWVHGHFHHPEHFPVGNGVTVFGTPALDGGSAWFTRKTGESSPPGIACLSMTNGKWINYSIL